MTADNERMRSDMESPAEARAELARAEKAEPLISHPTLTTRVRQAIQRKYLSFCRSLARIGWTTRAIIGLLRGRAALGLLLFGGACVITNYAPDGTVKWTTGLDPNLVVTEGLNKVCDVMFHNDTQVATWYVGLVDGGSSPTYAAADTLASHAGWTEYTAYDETNRQEWTEGAAAAGSITNSTSVDFSMNAVGTVAGMLLASVASGTGGTLWCGTNFSGGNQAVANADTLKVTYTLTASNG
jgi:hypothetical protein